MPESPMPLPSPGARPRIRFRAAVRLVGLSLRARRKAYASMLAAIAIGALTLGLALLGGLGPARAVRERLSVLFPAQRIVLRPRTIDMLWLQVKTAEITPATVEAVRDLEGVVRVSPEATLRFPVRAVGELLGSTFSTDIAVTGVEGWVLGPHIPASFSWSADQAAVAPAVVSEYFLDLYNMTLAESNHLPQLSRAAAIGRHFTLVLGESTLALGAPPPNAPEPRSAACRVVALSRNPDVLGLAIPLGAVDAFNAWYGHETKRYIALHVELESAEALDTLLPQLPALGLDYRDRAAPWRRAAVILGGAGVAILGLGALVFTLALIHMNASVKWMLAERRRELALYRAMGATPRQVVNIVGLEICLMAAMGCGVGMGVAGAILHAIDLRYMALAEKWPFLPESLFSVSWESLMVLGAGCWLVAAGLGLLRIRGALRENITEVLTREG
jgi:hypothetical protein